MGENEPFFLLQFQFHIRNVHVSMIRTIILTGHLSFFLSILFQFHKSSISNLKMWAIFMAVNKGHYHVIWTFSRHL